MMLFTLLGLVAGVLTTLAGMGGGLFLIAALTVIRGPHLALVLTSPALFVSNAHRAFTYRAAIDRRTALLVAAGGLPGALVGGLLLPAIPNVVVTVILVAMTLFAVLRAMKLVELTPKRASLTAAGAGVGALSATAGGAGMLMGPVLMAAGLSGLAFVATTSAVAVAMHIGRVAGYLASGLLTKDLIPSVFALLVGLLGGNVLGGRLRNRIPEGLEGRIELGALVVSTCLAVVGVGR